MGLLDLVTLHHEILHGLLRDGVAGRGTVECLADAGTFQAEALSSFEMAHRGFKEGVSALRRINEMLEEQARLIAHALHDEAGQLIASAHLTLEAIARDLPEATRLRLKEVHALLDQMEAHLRRQSHELRPTILDDLGLVPALEFLAQGVSSRSDLEIKVIRRPMRRLPPRVETALYRIVQEALRNAAKHSGGRHVEIEVSIVRHQALCAIRDDGHGFDAPAVLSGAAPRGLGLVGMRERLEALEGRMLVTSSRGKGTELRITIPLEGEHADSTPARR
jgi:signal transduction histidine kinase